MKPITFESIRNLLKTKKKSKDKSSSDQSFKRSDSFKRISIRKSYLERGRKRNVLRGSNKNLAHINEFERQIVIRQSEKFINKIHNNENGNNPIKTVTDASIEEKIESNDASLDEKIRALQEINDRYIKENKHLVHQAYETKHEEKVKIKKPPRPSKLKKIAENLNPLTHEDLNKSKSWESIATIGSSDTYDSTRFKNISQICINSTDVIPEEDENTGYIYDLEPVNGSGHKKRDDQDDKSFYSISTFTIESNHLNHTNESKKSNISAFSSSTRQSSELPSMVTIKTYCHQPPTPVTSAMEPVILNKYLETSFDHYDDPQDCIAPTKSKPKINTQTFKMVKSKTREGIIIRIPAIDSDEPSKNEYKDDENENEIENVEIENIKRQSSTDSALDLIEPHIKDDDKEPSDSKNKMYKKKHKKKKGEDKEEDILTFKSHENMEKLPKFIFPNNYFEEENNIYYDQTVYNETETIPYALRVKENPFTKNKEVYSINSGRIWKQSNLGLEEDLSILSAAVPKFPPKTKNESFKSMSSRDSGFSLTLTKPKNLFRRKSKKSTLLQRRKPKLAVSRDGYFKRVMVVQRNSSKRKKSNKKLRMQSKDIFKELYDENWSKLGTDDQLEQPDFARDFEDFCNSRSYNQEIHDLEAFYEEHLKRLRHYYIQKKKMNEAAIKEFYRDWDDSHENNDENDYYDSFIAKNETIRFKNNMQKMHFQGQEDNSLDYEFPHPDKRKIQLFTKQKQKSGNKRHYFSEVRTFFSPDVESSLECDLENGHVRSLERALPVQRTFVDHNFHLAASSNSAVFKLNRHQQNEISLANVFPSVEKLENVEDDEEEEEDEEFSENEFLINSLGDNLYCSRCDKINSDCECTNDENDEETNENSLEIGENEEDDDNYCDVYDFKDVNIVHINNISNNNNTKKRIKRKKSKKKIRKNHSTLRRELRYSKSIIYK